MKKKLQIVMTLSQVMRVMKAIQILGILMKMKMSKALLNQIGRKIKVQADLKKARADLKWIEALHL